MANEEVLEIMNVRNRNYNTAQQQNIMDFDKGVANAEKMSEIYKDILKDMEKIYSSGEESVKLMRDSAKQVVDAVDKAKNGVQAAKLIKQGNESYYADAKKKAAEKGDVKTVDRLRTQELEANIKAAKEFYDEQKKFIKGTFANIASGIFTFNFTEVADGFKALKGNLKDVIDYFGGLGNIISGGLIVDLTKAVHTLGKFTKGLESTIDSIAGYKTAWDTRLFGSDKGHTSIADLVKKNLAVSPYVKQEKVMENLNRAISEGIAYNVEQRAFLSAISDSIATTFDAFDTTLKDLVRVQQADSTAYRLGMEASLNQYLNSMFETTEYLSTVSDTVTSNLYQATSLLDASKAIGYEYQVQKWLGALYSVGMSSGAVGSISQALGQLLSGDISGTDSGAGKLLVMAAANSGLDYAKLLTDGINDSDVNLLLESMVDYLQEIASDNKVVQSQMANIFGLQTSDIEAATNLAGSIQDIFKTNSNYSSASASGMLDYMLSTVGSRMSIAQELENLTSNFKYTLAEGIATNPALYSILTIGDLLEETVGGINIPTVMALGTGVDLEASVADVLRATALGGSLLGGIGYIFSGLGDIGNGLNNVYKQFAANSNSNVSIGGGAMGMNNLGTTTSLMSMSYNANTSGDDYIAANDAMIKDTKNEALLEAEDTNDHKTMDNIWDLNDQMLQLLNEIVNDSKSFSVKVKNWEDSGWTK